MGSTRRLSLLTAQTTGFPSMRAHLDGRSTNEAYDITALCSSIFDMKFGGRVLRVIVLRLAICAEKLLRAEVDNMLKAAAEVY